MSVTGIIFDMDGTLWDSSQEVADSWTEVLQRHPEMDRVITRADMQSVMGMPMTGIAETLFSGLEHEQQMKLLDECTAYENEYLETHGGYLYPDLELTLERLSREYPLFIVSNCQSGYIEAFLKHYDFGQYFRDHLCFGDNGLPKSDNIRAVARRNRLDIYYYVGDIQADYDAAAKAGGQFIHAAYGYGTIRRPVPRILAFAELPRLLRSIEMSDREER